MSQQFLVQLKNDNFSSDILQVPSNINKKQLIALFNLENNVSLYVNGNMIVDTLEKTLSTDSDAESVKIIKMVESKGNSPAAFCSSVISGHSGPILKCLKSKNTLITCGADKTVRFWNVNTKMQFKVNQQHNHWVMAVEELKDYFITGGMDSSICLYTKEGYFIKTINKQKQGIVKLVKIENRNEFLSGARDGTIIHYEIDKQNDVKILNTYKHRDSLTDLVTVENVVVSSTIKGVIKVYNLSDFKYICDLNENQSRINCIAIRKIDKSIYIITGDDLGNVTLYKDYKVKYRMKHKREVMSISIDPNGINFITGSFDKSVMGWNMETGENLFTIYHFKLIYKVIYMNDLVISAGKDKLIKFYKPSTKEQVGSFVTGDEIFDFAYEDGQLIACCKDSNVYFYY